MHSRSFWPLSYQKVSVSLLCHKYLLYAFGKKSTHMHELYFIRVDNFSPISSHSPPWILYHTGKQPGKQVFLQDSRHVYVTVLTSIEQSILRFLKKFAFNQFYQVQKTKWSLLKKRILVCIGLSIGIKADTYDAKDSPV